MLRITLRKGMILLAVASVCLTSCSHQSSTFERARTDYMQQNYHNAFREARDLAYQHDPRGEYALGNMYFYGTGTVKDQDLARYWIKQAAKHGYQPAIVALHIIEQEQYQQYSPLDNVTGHKLISSPSRRLVEVKRERVLAPMVAKNVTPAKTTPLQVARITPVKPKAIMPANKTAKTILGTASNQKSNRLLNKVAVNKSIRSKTITQKANVRLDLTAPLAQTKPYQPLFEKDITAWGRLEKQQPKVQQQKPVALGKHVSTKQIHKHVSTKHFKATKVAYHKPLQVHSPVKKSLQQQEKKHEVKVATRHWRSDRELVTPATHVTTVNTKNTLKSAPQPQVASATKKANEHQKDITWALKQNYRNYTVQLSISSKAQKIEKIRQMKIPGCEMVAYRFRDGDKAKYSAVCGSFKKRADAEVILSALPASLKDQAAVYPWGAVQKNMQLY